MSVPHNLLYHHRPVERSAFRISVRPDRLDDYVEAHRAVWPELLAALRDAGVSNYSIFLDRERSQVFGYFEGEDLQASERAMATLDVNARWQAAMAPLVEAEITGVGPSPLPSIFRLD